MNNTCFYSLYLPLLMVTLLACGQTKEQVKTKIEQMDKVNENNIDTITLGGGCFWCMEAIYQRLGGVVSVTSGYCGGYVRNPTYAEVCNGTTGHAEVVQIVFDKNKISLEDILRVFFKVHDPTTLNRQGNDVGTQYRSTIFFRNEEQKIRAEEIKSGLDSSGTFDTRIVTEIAPLGVFYKAEDYHQNYFNENKNANPYCQFVIIPKLDKFEQYFHDKMKH